MDNEKTSSEKTPESDVLSHRHRILVVDDEPTIRALFEQALGGQQMDVVTFEMGAGALQSVEKDHYDLVFLDVRLPDVDGIDLLKRIHEIKPDLKVVMITGHGDSRQAMTAMRLGASEYLLKPFHMGQLHKILKLYLSDDLSQGDQSRVLENTVTDIIGAEKLQSQALLISADEALFSCLEFSTTTVGCSLGKVEDFSAAQKAMELVAYAVVVIDYKLHFEKACFFCEWAKKNAPSAELLLVSETITVEIMKEALSVGVSDFIVSPFSSREKMRGCFERALERHAKHYTSSKFQDELKRRNLEMELLYKISNAISYSVQYDVLINSIMESISHVIEFDLVITLLNVPEKCMTVYSRGDCSATKLEDCKTKIEETFSMLVTDWQGFEAYTTAYVRLGHPSPISGEIAETSKDPIYFDIPIMVQNKPVGLIQVSRFRGMPFSKEDIRLMSTLVNHMAASIERIRTIITGEQGKMEAVVQSMAEGIVLYDERGDAPTLNPQSRTLLGFSQDVEITIPTLFHKLKELSLKDIFEQCRKERKPVFKEIHVIGFTSKQVLRCDMSPVNAPDHGVIGTLIVLRDITREKELENMKTEFVSTVSHELRTPMAIIREGISQVLDGFHGDVTDDQKRFLNMTLSGVDRLGRMIDDLLDISKMEAGKVVLHRELLDFNQVAEDALADFEMKVKDHKIKLKKKLPRKRVIAYADRDHIFQVLMNLVGNALKFTEKGWVEIGVADRGESVEVAVKDTGKGISDKDLPRVFGKFQQFGRVYGPGEKGTGLGLAICKKIVEMHKGQIRVESKLNRGTSFIFDIPKISAQEIFRDHVYQVIALAKRHNTCASIIIFDIMGEHLKTKDEKKDEYLYLMTDLTRVVKSGLRREADTAIEDAQSILVALPQTTKEHALMAAGRIRQMCDNHVREQKLDVAIDIKCKVIGYPTDAASVEELIELI